MRSKFKQAGVMWLHAFLSVKQPRSHPDPSLQGVETVSMSWPPPHPHVEGTSGFTCLCNSSFRSGLPCPWRSAPCFPTVPSCFIYLPMFTLCLCDWEYWKHWCCCCCCCWSLQSCPTLCDPIESSPPGFPVPGILQARALEWVAISFSNAGWKWGRSVVSDSLWPRGLQPTRLLHPWDFPGKSSGVGCHCLLRSIGDACIFTFQRGIL